MFQSLLLRLKTANSDDPKKSENRNNRDRNGQRKNYKQLGNCQICVLASFQLFCERFLFAYFHMPHSHLESVPCTHHLIALLLRFGSLTNFLCCGFFGSSLSRDHSYLRQIAFQDFTLCQQKRLEFDAGELHYMTDPIHLFECYPFFFVGVFLGFCSKLNCQASFYLSE